MQIFATLYSGLCWKRARIGCVNPIRRGCVNVGIAGFPPYKQKYTSNSKNPISMSSSRLFFLWSAAPLRITKKYIYIFAFWHKKIKDTSKFISLNFHFQIELCESFFTFEFFFYYLLLFYGNVFLNYLRIRYM